MLSSQFTILSIGSAVVLVCSLNMFANLIHRFQWVVCQLDTVARCLSVAELRKALHDLPKGLDDTYARILSRIDGVGKHASVFRILQFLIYSKESLSVRQIAETVALDPYKKPYIDPSKRWPKAEEVLSMCSGLVIEQVDSDGPVPGQPTGLAHFSIQEFLLSPRILEGPAKNWFIDGNDADAFMTRAYLAHLLHFDDIDITRNTWNLLQKDYPLANTAAACLMQYARRVEESDCTGRSPILELFVTKGTAFLAFLKLRDGDGAAKDAREAAQDNTGLWPSALHTAARYGLCETVKQMLDLGAEVDARSNMELRFVAFSPGANYPAHLSLGATALIQASYYGHARVVGLLLERKADVNARGGVFGNALATAILGPFDGYEDDYGDIEVVRLLLDNGADVNADCGLQKDATLLQEALAVYGSHNSKQEIVELLIDYGADVDAPSPFGSLLEFTTRKDHNVIALKLLKNGISLEDPRGINALVWASRSQASEELILALLARGIDINARGSDDHYMGCCGQHTPLESACDVGACHAVALLLDNGADPNVRINTLHICNALECALNSEPDYDDDYDDAATLQLLLDNGADVTQVRRIMLNDNGKQKYEKLLLSRDVNVSVGEYRDMILIRRQQRPKPSPDAVVDHSMEIPFCYRVTES